MKSFLWFWIGLVSAHQCRMPVFNQCPAPTVLRFQLPKEGTPLQRQNPRPANFHLDNLFTSQPAPFRPLNLKIAVTGSDIPFQMSTDEDRQLHQELQELDDFLQENLPAVFGPSVDCQTLSESDCVEQEGCSWCSWPSEGCQFTEVADLFPTEERCVEGGEPLSFPEESLVICGDVWFDAC